MVDDLKAADEALKKENGEEIKEGEAPA